MTDHTQLPLLPEGYTWHGRVVSVQGEDEQGRCYHIVVCKPSPNIELFFKFMDDLILAGIERGQQQSPMMEVARLNYREGFNKGYAEGLKWAVERVRTLRAAEAKQA